VLINYVDQSQRADHYVTATHDDVMQVVGARDAVNCEPVYADVKVTTMRTGQRPQFTRHNQTAAAVYADIDHTLNLSRPSASVCAHGDSERRGTALKPPAQLK